MNKLELDINSHVRETLTRLSVPGNIKVESRLDQKLPLVSADPVQLGRLFVNIIENGFKAMPDGGTVDIKTIYDETAKVIQIEISDTGKGIEGGMIDDVFNPFFTTKSKRSGLGLAITRRVVEQHGGVISAKSDPGNWTRFIVYLPVSEKEIKEEKVIVKDL